MAWAPNTDLSGLTGWFAARKETTYADADPSGTITNFGSAASLTAAGSARPTFRKTLGPNGLPCFEFDGIDDEAAGSATSNYVSVSAASLALVVRLTGMQTNNTSQWWQNDLIVGEDAMDFGLVDVSSQGAVFANYDGANATVAKALAVADGWVILLARHDTGSIYLSRDGGSDGSATSGNTASLASNLKLGRSSVYNHPGQFRLAELLLGNVVWTASDRANLLAYLRGIYWPSPRPYVRNQAVNRAAVR